MPLSVWGGLDKFSGYGIPYYIDCIGENKVSKRLFSETLENLFQQKIDEQRLGNFIYGEQTIGSECCYNLKVQLGTRNSTWIRMQVSGESTLDQLSSAILNAIGFDNDHLYAFFWIIKEDQLMLIMTLEQRMDLVLVT